MHAIFMPYGKRAEVELLLRDMEAQKHKLIMTKNGKTKTVWVQGVIRTLPFGLVGELVGVHGGDPARKSLDDDGAGAGVGELDVDITGIASTLWLDQGHEQLGR